MNHSSGQGRGGGLVVPGKQPVLLYMRMHGLG